MLEVKNLMVFFENALAINDLSLEIKQGELVGMIGSNSAGKTTLMNYQCERAAQASFKAFNKSRARHQGGASGWKIEFGDQE